MTPNPARAARAVDPHDDARDWLPMAAFGFVLVALVALAAIPSVLLQRVTRAAEDIATTVLPANDALQRLAFAMEARVATSRSRFLSNDPRYEVRLAEAKRAESEALRTLTVLAPSFGVAATRHLESLRRYMALRDSIEARVVGGDEELEAYRAALPRFDAIRDSMLVELRGVQGEVMRIAEARAAEEARWGDLQRAFSFLLGSVALVAALIVGWFALRQRRLRRELQQALAAANRERAIAERRGTELERATEARARLLRGVTHDVKNPLGAAKGYAELIEMGVKAPMLPEQAPLVKGVLRSVDGALAIIADLLDLARADSGGLAIDRVEVDLRLVVREAAEGHRPAAEAAGHSMELRLPAEEVRVQTDPARVGQILGNLLSNAIKYTPPPGRITVGCRLRQGVGAPDHDDWAAVEVGDTGPGIPPEQRQTIFEEFTRLDDGGRQAGHGLGLAIARRIARLLGGELTVESAPAGGARFVLWLPLRQDELPDR